MNKLMNAGAILCITFTMIVQQNASASDFVGVRQIVATSKERNVDLTVTVWYPADAGGEAVDLGETRFFTGTQAMLDAPMSTGKYPLILLSHGAGLGGTPEAMSWVATPLAKQGYIVAAPLHPGNGGSNRSAAETMKMWLRPADVSSTLDMMESQPLFGSHLQLGRTGALGLSMGGTTVLGLVGGLIDPVLLANYCDGELNPSLCGWVKQSGVDLHAMDMKLAGRDNRDRRIKFAMAIDPAPVDVFQIKSFSHVSIPVQVVNLGRPGAIPLTALASGITATIPEGDYSRLEDASHFSMFGECQSGAAQVAKSEGIDEPICSDGEGLSRARIHSKLIDMITKAFNKNLKAEN